MIKNGLYISKLEATREVKPFTVFGDNDKLLLDINTFGFEQTFKLVENLRQVLDGKFIFEYEWSGPRISFESSREKTIVKDMIFNNNSLSYNTIDLYNILRNRYLYLRQLNEAHILSKASKAFGMVKKNVHEYVVGENRYRIFIDNEQIDLLLLPQDVLLSVEEFMSQIKINYTFLPPLSVG
ncbi:MAG: hypothetical protein NXI08_16445 [bacterium]|nr:hypothetical protein [bacterium]